MRGFFVDRGRLNLNVKNILQFAVVLLLFCFLSCEKNNIATFDVTNDVPVLTNWTVTPSTLNIDNITPSNGSYPVSAIVKVKAFSKDDTRSQIVSASIFRPNGSAPFSSKTLRDDGVPPDQVAGDSLYSGQIDFQLVRGETGRYRIQLSSRSASGNTSNFVDAPLFLTRNNSAPRLFNLNAPDSLRLNPGDSLLINMNVAATDSDGLADIREVFFRSLDSSDPNRHFVLRDDGNGDRLSPSGDERAGDGIYTILVKLTDSPTVRRTFRFAFQAADSFSDTSRTLLHFLTIR